MQIGARGIVLARVSCLAFALRERTMLSSLPAASSELAACKLIHIFASRLRAPCNARCVRFHEPCAHAAVSQAEDAETIAPGEEVGESRLILLQSFARSLGMSRASCSSVQGLVFYLAPPQGNLLIRQGLHDEPQMRRSLPSSELRCAGTSELSIC
eukprot:178914-Pleurochrysis_carterae.AAC.1